MAEWQYDTKKEGLATVFFDYEIETLRLLWSRRGEYLSSRQVWEQISRKLQISRASVINSLNRMARAGILEYKETTGKGGYRGLYAASGDEGELKKRIAKELAENIKKNLS
jgi:predicted transcriptional regulator